MTRTVVISDLHLGVRSGADVLRHPEARKPLMEVLRDAGRLVVLGDAVELREVPVREAARHAADLIAEAGAALGAGGEIVMLAGNHDHGLVAGWIETRLNQSDPHSLGLEHVIEPHDAGPLPEALAAAAGPARLTLAYPGIRLRDDVYAMHGHYLDLHTTVPSFERLAAGAMARWVAPIPEREATPDDYERALAPLYAWLHSLAQRPPPDGGYRGHGASHRARRALSDVSSRRARARAAGLGIGYAGAIGLVNRLGIGPVQRDISGPSLRRGGLLGMGEVVRRLEIDADHVIFGHTHRGGPYPTDDHSEWVAPGGQRLHNTGSWIQDPGVERGAESPYRPGSAIVLDEAGEPRLERLLPAGLRARAT